MAQKEVLQFLKNNPEGWFTTKELSKLLGPNKTSINVNVNKLRRTGEVRYKFRRPQHGGYLYQYKHSEGKLKNET